jgi:predicted phosphodiesterase
MSWEKRLQEAVNEAYEIKFKDSDKFILFSDVHRGVNDWSDDFAHNQLLYFFALKDYFKKGYQYIEIGDGDELWENRHFSDIRYAHSHIFWILGEYFKKGRLHLIYGNHDIEKKNKRKLKETHSEYINEITEEKKELFPDLKVHPCIKLIHEKKGYELILMHGHQADWISGLLWPFSRFMVRYFWKRMQLLGFRDPTSPAKNFKKAQKIDKKLKNWAQAKKTFLIAGHTHRSRLADDPRKPYFNTGSCVHPRCITGLEISNGQIALIKWWFALEEKSEKESDCVKIKKTLLAPSKKLSNFFK